MEEQANQNKGNSSSKVGLAIIGIIVIAFIGIVAYQSQNKNAATTQPTPTVTTNTQTEQVTSESSPTEAVSASAYKDGTYTAVGHYTSPGGAEELGVTLTIADGVVTDSEVEVKATRPTSVERQTDFATHYKPQVEGKNIDEISLTKVSGSSLSPKGFNDAVAEIKSQAQS